MTNKEAKLEAEAFVKKYNAPCYVYKKVNVKRGSYFISAYMKYEDKSFELVKCFLPTNLKKYLTLNEYYLLKDQLSYFHFYIKDEVLGSYYKFDNIPTLQEYIKNKCCLINSEKSIIKKNDHINDYYIIELQTFESWLNDNNLNIMDMPFTILINVFK